MRHVVSRLLTVIAGAVLAVGCSTSDSGVGGQECSATFSAARCEAILVAAAGREHVDPTRVAGIVILPNDAAGMDRAGAVRLRLTLDNGRTIETEITCPGIAAAFQAECMAEPHVVINYSGSSDSGYHDIPENATPFPDPDPNAVAAAQPLLIDHRTVPIVRTGPTRVVLGQARLANGMIQEASLELGDDWPDSVVLRGAVMMEIAPAGGGDPIWNIYEHGWHDGVELVDVTLTFDAALLREGAALELVNVIVR